MVGNIQHLASMLAMSRSSVRHLVRAIGGPLFDLAYKGGLYGVAARFLGGCGIIFSLHRTVLPGHPLLHPGHMIPANVLDEVLGLIRNLGWQIVSVDDARRRLMDQCRSRSDKRRFACFTCDDGYLDNLTVGLPVFKKHNAPFTVYLTTGFLERKLLYWWGCNQELVLGAERIELPQTVGLRHATLWARTLEEKVRAYRTLDTICHRLGDGFLEELHRLYDRHGIEPRSVADRHLLSLDDARQLALDPLVTIGAHCVTHRRLLRMTEAEVRSELIDARRSLQRWFGVTVRHLAYPFGRRDACGPREFGLAQQAGYETAVTTRQGNIFPEHREYLMCLPRRSFPMDAVRARNALFGLDALVQCQPKFQTIE